MLLIHKILIQGKFLFHSIILNSLYKFVKYYPSQIAYKHFFIILGTYNLMPLLYAIITSGHMKDMQKVYQLITLDVGSSHSKTK